MKPKPRNGVSTSVSAQFAEGTAPRVDTFDSSAVDSRAFQSRLIELVAVALPGIAVWLFKQGSCRPKDDPLLSWRPSEELLPHNVGRQFPPTLFLHPCGGSVDAVYFHSDDRDVTYRIYRLLDEQKRALLRFLLAEDPSSAWCPLPIHGDLKNRVRIDPEESIAETGIYRDLWGRKPLTGEVFDLRTKDEVDQFNYTSYEAWSEANRRVHLAKYNRSR